MSHMEIAVLSFPLLIFMIVCRIPIGLSMLLVGIGGNYLVNGQFLQIFSQFKDLPYETFSNYSLSVVPLFLAMGIFATHAGISKSLFNFAQTWLGHKKGGVALSAIGACAGFGAICGSSLATAATISKVAIPEMRKCGYSKQLTAGCLAAGGTLGVLIPPSIVLIIYAILTEQNIAKLFFISFIPGILAVIGYMVAVAIYTRIFPDSIKKNPVATWKERRVALFDVWPILVIFCVVVFGIYLGFFTPTEGASVGTLCTFLMVCLKGKMSFKILLDSLLETATSSAMILFVVLGAWVFNSFLAFAQLPQNLAEWILLQNLNPFTVLIAVLFFYLVLGCFMDSLSMILLTIPIFFPALSALDFGMPPEHFALWFGILTLIVVEVGLITPPVGMNLFVINSMSDEIQITDTYKGVIPFLISDFIRIVLLIFFPVITLGVLSFA